MKLTDKALKDFEEWCNEEQTFDLGNLYFGFYSLDVPMQIGIYELFFDTKWLTIDVNPVYGTLESDFNVAFWSFSVVSACGTAEFADVDSKSRLDAYKIAIEKANEIYNGRV
jgi:hypothetical protein